MSLIIAADMSRFNGVATSRLAGAALQVVIDKAGEDPRFDAHPVTGAVPICEGVEAAAIKPLRLAFGWMRGTDEGRRLFDILIEHDVCIEVDDLSYALAFAQSRWSTTSGWAESRIVVDRSLIRSGGAQTLAVVLVHEATHVDRVISGESCHLADECRLLPNGVAIDEEIVAHAAEAEWWIEAYGSDGKRFAFGSQDVGENNVASAYLEGEAAFDDYITRMRSNPREGEDF
ncbi:MAG: hypothetical protein IT336_04380 [Thermomicrobiales bacterium]|nr:hypothetical protein [Thermomicrobiales bacterium]